ncbi:uncharacterized protein LY89DRAFT_713132 [Mollisia scopiformis]|uniref:Uncharacterized protein n=1 Tax=Mollisia scopiformis TaxID=149040 RepID=A0A194XVS1_MOLSC|nr:uncharacterized protein LY89DRAFT_713132 [Mollisia scopiformis]KUJ24241.1 hypothetical protein LY89DRAFT_713132 [Mollisia scopiformis]
MMNAPQEFTLMLFIKILYSKTLDEQLEETRAALARARERRDAILAAGIARQAPQVEVMVDQIEEPVGAADYDEQYQEFREQRRARRMEALRRAHPVEPIVDQIQEPTQTAGVQGWRELMQARMEPLRRNRPAKTIVAPIPDPDRAARRQRIRDELIARREAHQNPRAEYFTRRAETPAPRARPIVPAESIIIPPLACLANAPARPPRMVSEEPPARRTPTGRAARHLRPIRRTRSQFVLKDRDCRHDEWDRVVDKEWHGRTELAGDFVLDIGGWGEELGRNWTGVMIVRWEYLESDLGFPE